ncbi:MAG: FAD-binding protein [Balneolaceae bacterium]|nr:MAG: FAD-binding protein [Balneolaceae bacterium]
MKTNEPGIYDVIVAGAGMGGMSAAALLSADGYNVLVLEAAHVPGGCSSSFQRKGHIFESGATTLIGFDEHQPMRILEEKLGITIPRKAIVPSMTVHQDGKKIIRWQEREQWIGEVTGHFGEANEQRKFWELAFRVSDVVWKVSGRNPFFPPLKPSEYAKLLKNDPRDVWVLPHALRSVRKTAKKAGISNPAFFRFLDEQLMISSQAHSHETPFLFGAPAITYTNYTNYYVPGGLLEMVRSVQEVLEQTGGVLKTRTKVASIRKRGELWHAESEKGERFRGRAVVSNLPVWNMADLTPGKMKSYFRREAERYDQAWGAFTMGIVTDDVYPEEITLHHQIHIDPQERVEGLDSDSLFVSFSAPEDEKRSKNGKRVLNVSTHADPDYWLSLNGSYETGKARVQEAVTRVLRTKLPGFDKAEIDVIFSSTPVSWGNWVYRYKGRVGGIPQSMNRSLLDWTPAKTPFGGLYLCGDTVFPGQGIPGVTLSGINVYYRIKEDFKKNR